jgi:hypothetical protein
MVTAKSVIDYMMDKRDGQKMDKRWTKDGQKMDSESNVTNIIVHGDF